MMIMTEEVNMLQSVYRNLRIQVQIQRMIMSIMLVKYGPVLLKGGEWYIVR